MVLHRCPEACPHAPSELLQAVLSWALARARAQVVQRCAPQCSTCINRPYMCLREHQPFDQPFKLVIVKYHSPSSNHLRDTRCA